jgi:hypothetical protein
MSGHAGASPANTSATTIHQGVERHCAMGDSLLVEVAGERATDHGQAIGMIH